jgi:hypothetical protein
MAQIGRSFPAKPLVIGPVPILLTAAAYVADRDSSVVTSVDTNHTVGLPVDIANLDYILVAAVVGAVTTVSTPSGFTELVATSDAALGEYRIWYKLADGSETSTSFTTGIAAVSAHLSWSIRNSSVPQVANANGTSATPDPPSLSPSGGIGQHLWLAIEGFFGAVTQTAGPTSYIEVRTEALAAVGGIGGAERTTIAASEDPTTFTLSGSGVWRTSTLAFPIFVPAAAADKSHMMLLGVG